MSRGLNDNAAEIPGFGPVVADVARKAAIDNRKGQWCFTVTDRESPSPPAPPADGPRRP